MVGAVHPRISRLDRNGRAAPRPHPPQLPSKQHLRPRGRGDVVRRHACFGANSGVRRCSSQRGHRNRKAPSCRPRGRPRRRRPHRSPPLRVVAASAATTMMLCSPHSSLWVMERQRCCCSLWLRGQLGLVRGGVFRAAAPQSCRGGVRRGWGRQCGGAVLLGRLVEPGAGTVSFAGSVEASRSGPREVPQLSAH
jgi:hypothetical protein